MKKVSIYTTPSCVYCRMTKEFLKEKGVEYDEHDVFSDLVRREEMVSKSDQLGVPVIVVTDGAGQEEVIVGFDRPRLSAALGL